MVSHRMQSQITRLYDNVMKKEGQFPLRQCNENREGHYIVITLSYSLVIRDRQAERDRQTERDKQTERDRQTERDITLFACPNTVEKVVLLRPHHFSRVCNNFDIPFDDDGPVMIQLVASW